MKVELLLVCLCAPAIAYADATTDKANEELAAEAARYNPDGKFTMAFSVDWKSAKDVASDKSNAGKWARKCGTFMGKVKELCSSGEDGKLVEPCVAHANQTIKQVRCVVVDDSSKEGVKLEGATLAYSMADGMDSSAREAMGKALYKVLPKRRTLMLQYDADTYFAKQDEAQHAPLTVDAASFPDWSMTGIATYCSPAWTFLGMVNHPECQLKGCKGDGAKKKKFLEGAKQMQCVHSKEPKAPEVKASTLVYYTGEWASETGSLDGIPFAAFEQLRGKLKLRDCGVDDSSTDPRGGGGVMTSHARKLCCPKDSAGKCMDMAYEKSSEEVCKPIGFSDEKRCHRRDVLKKAIRDKAR
jgi:hypothetical protein